MSAADERRMRALESFPPGHPSSPYQADGFRRPAEPSLRSLELPIPDEWADEWDASTSDPSKGASEWRNSGDWAASWNEWGAGADAPGGAVGRHGEDAAAPANDSGGRYVDPAGPGGDTHGGDGRTGQGDWNGGPIGRGAGDGPGGRDSDADAGAGKADDAVQGTSGLNEGHRGQAGESSDAVIPGEPRGNQATADNTAGRTRADNAQTADAMPPPEGIHRSYWTEIPRFKRLWVDHEAAWPKDSQPAAKIERSGDPPGSWRSDSNLFLSPDNHARAKDAINRSRDTEPYVTTDLQNIANESPPSTKLVGLEFRCKGEERLKEKVAEALQRRPDSTPEETVQNINDTIRYTVQLNREDYTEGHRTFTEELQERGYELYYQANHWDDSEYKGINTRWLTPAGQKFELQFHTPESYHAKQEITHEAYERLRNRMTTRAEVAELRAFQQEVSSWIPLPDGAKNIPSYRKDNR